MSVPKKPETLVSIDGEFTGLVPGLHSMISFAAIAYTPGGEEIATFKRNMFELPTATHWPATMRWWDDHSREYHLATEKPIEPLLAMQEFDLWLLSLPGRPILMGWPLSYDFMFFTWYYVKFVCKELPFGHSGLDIRSFAMACLKTKTFAGESDGISMEMVAKLLHLPNSGMLHDPLDDARRQAKLYFGLRRMLDGVTVSEE